MLVLGPVVFSIFINDQGTNLLKLNSKVIKFANHTSLVRAMKKKTRRHVFMKRVINLWGLLLRML